MKVPEKEDAIPSKSWWSTPPDGWSDVSDATYKRWFKNERRKIKRAALRAMAFGYGSRATYGEYRSWKDLAGQLEKDWQEAGPERKHPWKQVRSAVKAGWTAAGADLEPVEDASTSIEPPPADPPAASTPQNVPGGRPGSVAAAPVRAEHDASGTHMPGGRPDHQ